MKSIKRFFVERRPFKGHLDLYLGEEFNGKMHAFKDVTVEEISTSQIPPVFLTINPDEAQMFMDELWRVGVRPSSGEGNTGQLQATESHLKDIRKLLFNQLEIKE